MLGLFRSGAGGGVAGARHPRTLSAPDLGRGLSTNAGSTRSGDRPNPIRSAAAVESSRPGLCPETFERLQRLAAKAERCRAQARAARRAGTEELGERGAERHEIPGTPGALPVETRSAASPVVTRGGESSPVFVSDSSTGEAAAAGWARPKTGSVPVAAASPRFPEAHDAA